MRPPQFMLPLASALLAAVVATLVVTIPTLVQTELPWNIVVVSRAADLAEMIFIVAVVHALVIGLPVFLMVRETRRVGIGICALGGFLVGAVPFGVLAMSSMTALTSASTGGTLTVINGVPTLAGWIEYASSVGSAGLLGLAGGLTFWAAMRLSGQTVGKPNKPVAESNRLRAGSWSIVSAAVLLTCTIFLLPTLARDNSCHNLYRDRPTFMRPQISAEIKLSAEDLPALGQIFVDFGAAHSLSFRRDEEIQRGTITWLDLSLCNEAGINIDAVDQPWLSEINSPFPNREIQFAVYELKAGSGWTPLARDLLNKIELTWPQKTTFRGPDGTIVSAEDALKGQQ